MHFQSPSALSCTNGLLVKRVKTSNFCEKAKKRLQIKYVDAELNKIFFLVYFEQAKHEVAKVFLEN